MKIFGLPPFPCFEPTHRTIQIHARYLTSGFATIQLAPWILYHGQFCITCPLWCCTMSTNSTLIPPLSLAGKAATPEAVSAAIEPWSNPGTASGDAASLLILASLCAVIRSGFKNPVGSFPNPKVSDSTRPPLPRI